MTLQQAIGIYVRKSSNKQSELTLPAQERLIRAFLAHQQLCSPKTMVYQDILSGTRPDRAGYQQMLADARAGRISMVVFHKINRFGRDVVEGLQAMHALRSLGIEIRIVDLPTLDVRKPEGAFIFTFLLGQGQYEVENLGQESRKGMEEKVQGGGWTFLAPDGYSNLREEIAPRKVRSWVAIDRPRAAIIRLIYRWYATGTMTLADLVTRLEQLHSNRIARGKHGCRARRGGAWYPQQLWQILKNRFYIGEIRVQAWTYTGLGTHPPIISLALFQRVQDTLADRHQDTTRKHHYLLQGRLWIQQIPLFCTQVVRRQRVYQYYYHRLPNRKRVYYLADPIDQQVISAIYAHLATLGDDPAHTLVQRFNQTATQRQAELSTQITNLQAARSRLMHFATRGRFTEAEVDAEMNQLEHEHFWLQAEQQQIDQLIEMQTMVVADMMTIINTFQQWDRVSPEQQYTAIKQCVARVVLSADQMVERVQWQSLWQLLWYPDLPREWDANPG